MLKRLNRNPHKYLNNIKFILKLFLLTIVRNQTILAYSLISDFL